MTSKVGFGFFKNKQKTPPKNLTAEERKKKKSEFFNSILTIVSGGASSKSTILNSYEADIEKVSFKKNADPPIPIILYNGNPIETVALPVGLVTSAHTSLGTHFDQAPELEYNQSIQLNFDALNEEVIANAKSNGVDVLLEQEKGFNFLYALNDKLCQFVMDNKDMLPSLHDKISNTVDGLEAKASNPFTAEERKKHCENTFFTLWGNPFKKEYIDAVDPTTKLTVRKQIKSITTKNNTFRSVEGKTPIVPDEILSADEKNEMVPIIKKAYQAGKEMHLMKVYKDGKVVSEKLLEEKVRVGTNIQSYVRLNIYATGDNNGLSTPHMYSQIVGESKLAHNMQLPDVGKYTRKAFEMTEKHTQVVNILKALDTENTGVSNADIIKYLTDTGTEFETELLASIMGDLQDEAKMIKYVNDKYVFIQDETAHVDKKMKV